MDLEGNSPGAVGASAMRRILPDQLVLVPAFHTHVHSREVRAMSRILDEHPEVAKWVHDDLVGRKGRKQGGCDPDQAATRTSLR